jgi:hypothetical protein
VKSSSGKGRPEGEEYIWKRKGSSLKMVCPLVKGRPEGEESIRKRKGSSL